MIRVGIVGAGGMGATHARNLIADPRVQISGIADMIPAKAEALAGETGARACGSVEALLDSGVDAMYVTTPNTQHAPAVLAALARNVHVFSEKPMATTLAEAAQIRAAARQSTAIYQVGHNRRFAPAYRFLKDRIAEGFQPYLANAKQNDGDWLNPPWITNLALTGGFLYESSVHLLDMLRWLMGEVVAVNARSQARVYDLPCDFAILLTFEGNRHAVFSSSAHASWAFPFESVEIVGEHACLRSEEMTRAFYSPGLAQEMLTRDYTQLPRALQWGYRQADEAFITAIVGQQASAVSVEDAYKSIELCEACYRSAAQEGATVRLPLEEAGD
jgi:myo-inositol 2-dehydrogenase/D-chiro-inositol 1-dehydrogenase